MQQQLKRGGAIAAIAALSVGAAAGVATSAASAATTAPVAPSAPAETRILGLGSLPVLGPVLAPILNQVSGTTPMSTSVIQDLAVLPPLDLATVLGHASAPQLTTLLDTLAPTKLVEALTVLDVPLIGTVLDTALGQAQGPDLIANLLHGAQGGQLTNLLGALDPTALEDVVNTLLPAPLTDVLGGASGGNLTTLVGALDPAKITQLLSTSPDAGTVTSLVTGLTGVLGAGGSASALAGPLAQLQALLAGLPVGTDLLQLDGLLGTVTGLLDTAGLGDLPIVQPLLDTLTKTTATHGGTPTTGLTTLTSGLASLLGARPTSTTPTSTTPRPTTPTTATPAAKPVTPAARPTAVTPAVRSYRATIGRALVTKSRKSAAFTVTCPKTAPKGCVVQVSASLAAKKVLKPTWIAVLSGTSQRVSVQLPKSATSRLKAKGGTLKFRAATATSTTGAVSKSLKVKKTAKKKASAKR